jgi:basic membrane lipoprotein Med (substrate-binding protein (PBP1-ABC) superfamily)
MSCTKPILGILTLALALGAFGRASADAKIVVGALHVGSVKDAGYNQASHDGLEQLKKNIPGLVVLEAENVPESADAERVMEQMINKGATIIIAQSFGFQDPALNVAAKYPKVTFLHASGFKLAPNFGTFWGNNFEAMYLAGISAGAATKTGKLGFITAFPIPNILASINAFELGARTQNPKVTTTVTYNNAWVDPVKEAAAVNALADAGVDVVTMITDSPITIVKTAESRGMKSIGFHSDALAQFAPKGWLTGVAYTWGDLYTRLVKEIVGGAWKSGHVRGGIESGYLKLAAFGPSVTPETKAKIAKAQADIVAGKLVIFQGPLKDNAGNVVIPEGKAGGIELLDTTKWLIEGVIGQAK